MGVQSTGGKVSAQDLLNGAVLQCIEAATLGMPLEVWKTRMGRFRNEGAIEAFMNVYKRGGVGAYWAGTSAKMVESATKGGILLFSKEAIASFMLSNGSSETLTGFVSGAGGGISQVVVLGPCTFLVTAAVTGDKSISMSQRITSVWAKEGIKGFYPGGVALAFRQSTNWASRQGFTELIRGQFKVLFHGDEKAKLTMTQEALAGTIGGAISCWNHPFEVTRIQMQATAAEGKDGPKPGMVQVMSTIVKEQGVSGLFKGITPRILLGVWQTLFMVTGAKVVKQYLDGKEK